MQTGNYPKQRTLTPIAPKPVDVIFQMTGGLKLFNVQNTNSSIFDGRVKVQLERNPEFCIEMAAQYIRRLASSYRRFDNITVRPTIYQGIDLRMYGKHGDKWVYNSTAVGFLAHAYDTYRWDHQSPNQGNPWGCYLEIIESWGGVE